MYGRKCNNGLRVLWGCDENGSNKVRGKTTFENELKGGRKAGKRRLWWMADIQSDLREHEVGKMRKM
jgi:hypothetical protein